MGSGAVAVIEGDKKLPVNRKVAGVNCERPNLPHGGNDYNQEAFVEMMKDSGCPFFRYPGGTGSNYHHPLTGFVVPVEGSKGEQGRIKLNEKIKKDFGESGWNEDNFFEMVRDTGIQYTLVLNVFTATIDENRDALRALKRKEHPVDFIEIGNELFFREYTRFMGGVDAYLDKVKRMSRIIRRIFPDAQIGICIPNHVYQQKYVEGRGKEDVREWIDVTAANPEHYDAVIFHAYSNNGTPKGSEVVPTFDLAMKTSLSYLDEQLHRTLDYVEQTYPGKAIWLTEYGVGEFPPGPLRAEFAVGKKYCGSLHNTVFLMKLLQRPSVEIAHWHCFSKFTHPRRREKTRTVTMRHFSLISKLLGESSAVVPVSVSDSEEYEVNGVSHTALEMLFFSRNGESKGKLVVVNKGDRAAELKRVAWASGGQESEMCKGKMRVTGPAVDVPIAEALANQFDACEVDEEEHCSSNCAVSIPPYAVAILTLAE